MKNCQRGFLLITVVAILVVVAVAAAAILHITTPAATSSNSLSSSYQAFTIADAGLSQAAAALTSSNPATRIACANVPTLNTTYSNGTAFSLSGTLSTVSVPLTASTVGPTDTIIPLSSISGWPKCGRIWLDKEAIDYIGFSTNPVGLYVAVRGAAGTAATYHYAGTMIAQNQCTVISTGTVSKPPAKRIVSRVVVQSQEAWAVGNNNTIVHWNGTLWTTATPTTVTNNTTKNLYGISMLNFADGWIVGDVGSDGKAIIYRFSGGTWTQIPVTQNNVTVALYDVVAISATEAWAVGKGGKIAKWNGTAWNYVTNPASQDLHSITIIDADSNGHGDYGYAVGDNGTVLYFNGSSWSSIAPLNLKWCLFTGFCWNYWSSYQPINFRAVRLLSNTQGVLGGCKTQMLTLSSGNNWLWTGGPSTVFWNYGNDDFYSVDFQSTKSNGVIDQIIAVGTVFSTWSSTGNWAIGNPPATMNGVIMYNYNDSWAVGQKYHTTGNTDSYIFHWDGTTWTPYPITGVNTTLNAVTKTGTYSTTSLGPWSEIAN